MCHGCCLTDRGCLNPNDFDEVKSWAITSPMVNGGDLFIPTKEDIERSSGRIKVKLLTDGPGGYSGLPPSSFENCTNALKQIAC